MIPRIESGVDKNGLNTINYAVSVIIHEEVASKYGGGGNRKNNITWQK
jgi:hypothetical protein